MAQNTRVLLFIGSVAKRDCLARALACPPGRFLAVFFIGTLYLWRCAFRCSLVNPLCWPAWLCLLKKDVQSYELRKNGTLTAVMVRILCVEHAHSGAQALCPSATGSVPQYVWPSRFFSSPSSPPMLPLSFPFKICFIWFKTAAGVCAIIHV